MHAADKGMSHRPLASALDWVAMTRAIWRRQICGRESKINSSWCLDGLDVCRLGRMARKNAQKACQCSRW